MILNKKKLKKLTEEFAIYVLGDSAPDKMCFTVCYPLSLHLTSNGYENSIKSGVYNSTPHYIIALNNRNKTIIDPTIQQFDITQSKVLITSLSESEKYRDFQDRIFKDAHEEWLYPLMNNGSRKPLPSDLLDSLTPDVRQGYLKPIDIIPILTISDRAAHILQKSINKSFAIKEYLETVRIICNQNFFK